MGKDDNRLSVGSDLDDAKVGALEAVERCQSPFIPDDAAEGAVKLAKLGAGDASSPS